jgi:hypothetical protein
MPRGHFSSGVIRTLMQRAGGKCSNPECGRDTLGPTKEAHDKSQLLGEAAHIKSASPKGPRYDAGQSEEERQGVENGIWLCERCASLVDKNKGDDFSPGSLRVWKFASERAALDRIYRLSDSVRDNCVSSLIFINIPRLHHLIAQTKQGVSLPTYFDDGIPGDGYIAPGLHGLERAIARLRFPALEWNEASKQFDDPTGLIVSFEGQFRTKNGPSGRRDRRERDLTNLKSAPHIYQKLGELKLVLPYDPKFITTSTAGVELTSGRCRVGGFASIKKRVGDDIIASPFIIGLASTPEARSFMDALASHQRTN